MGLAGPSRTLRTIVLLLIAAVPCSSACGKVIHVDDDAAGANDGTSWANAYVYLQDALTQANDSAKPVEILVAQGVYRPDRGVSQTPGDRAATFQLANGVTLAGGFAGHREPDPNARDVTLYETILSGDLNGDDATDFTNNAENSHHVVTASHTDETAVLDGFTITGGNANADLHRDDRGGGMYNDRGSPTVARCTFRQNTAAWGGGVWNREAAPVMTDCDFTGNRTAGYPGYGAGMCNDHSSPTLTRCTFSANEAVGGLVIWARGGGMYNDSGAPTLTNCEFTGNVAGHQGGAVYTRLASPKITACVFRANHAYSGGAMYNDVDNVMLADCTFERNTAEYDGGAMRGSGMEAVIRDCTFASCSASYGGALALCWGTISHCSITDNSAAMYGGGLYNCQSAISDCRIARNEALEEGGGLKFCDRLISDCTIRDNEAGRDGGGLSSCRGTIDGCIISGNSANQGGGLSGCGFVRHCTITGNSAENSGGGVNSARGVTDCIITDNSAGDGGGLSSCGEVTNCTISRNVAIGFETNPWSGRGGGLYQCWGPVTNCAITGNSALYGGGLQSCGRIDHCTIVGNAGSVQGAVDACRGPITNCIIWANRPARSSVTRSIRPRRSCLQDDTQGVDCITGDPRFVVPGFWDKNTTAEDAGDDTWVEGDYHLSADSPCIDAGNYHHCMHLPSTDRDGGTRLAGPQVDLGCHEVLSQPDTDGDWLADVREAGYATDPDRDNDGRLDGVERLSGTDANTPDPLRQWHVPKGIDTIQEALFLSRSGETIVLDEGTYHENIYLGGRNIVLTSIDPNDRHVVSDAVLCGDSGAESSVPAGSVITLSGKEDRTCQIRGLTITGGNASQGGGIYGAGALATVTRCVISDNLAGSGGGLDSCNGLIDRCLITGNKATSVGGGLSACNGLIDRCVVTGNDATWSGGGLWRGHGTLTNCVISGNTASSGAGLFNSGETISNCTIVGNAANSEGGGLYQDDGYGTSLTNCIVWGNRAPRDPQIAVRMPLYNPQESTTRVRYCDVEGGWAEGEGNMDVDPCFAEPGFWDTSGAPDDPKDDFWVDGDYHLRSGTGRWDPESRSWIQDEVISSCIDTGDPDSDWTAELWPNGRRINIGAYGGTRQASMSPNDVGSIADLNHEGFVGYADLRLFVLHWLHREALLAEDFDRDGAVDLGDFLLLAADWRDRQPPPRPGQASDPQPADGTTGVRVDSKLSWTAGHTAVSHDVYFGTESPGTFCCNQTSTTFDPGPLAGSTTYYWQIDEVNGTVTRTGEVWTFTTAPGGGRPPGRR